jgi:hypothetical protein
MTLIHNTQKVDDINFLQVRNEEAREEAGNEDDVAADEVSDEYDFLDHDRQEREILDSQIAESVVKLEDIYIRKFQ